MRRAALVCSLLLGACNNGGSGSGLQIQLVNGGGGAPLPDTLEGTLRVQVKQGDAAPIEQMTDVVDGLFDLSVPIPSPTAATAIHVRVEEGEHPSHFWIGSAPTFSPYGEGVEIVRIVVSEPSTCSRIAMLGASSRANVHLTQAGRIGAAMVPWKSLAFIGGGLDLDGMPLTGGDWIDLVAWDIVAIDDVLATAPGRVNAIDLATDQSLYIGDARQVQLLARESTASREPIDADLPMHQGASSASAIADLGANGVAIVGGNATRGITWLSRDAASHTMSELAVERTSPAVIQAAGGLLVVGGQAPGGPDAEFVQLSGDGQALAIDLPDGHGGALVPDPSGQSFLWIAWTDGGGYPSASSVILHGCPGACAMVAGPDWTNARASASLLRVGNALWIAGGEDTSGVPSPLVERVHFDASGAAFDPPAMLAFGRAEPTLVHHAAGLVLVAGGRDRNDSGMPRARDDMELCFPPDLDPI